MSQEAVARFLDLVASDAAAETAMNAAAQQGADIAAAAVGLGRKHDLEFSAEEFVSAVQAFRREHPGQLDEAELAGVSGGFNPQPEPPGVWGMPSGKPWFSQQWTAKLTSGM
jgi:hypothetical protein